MSRSIKKLVMRAGKDCKRCAGCSRTKGFDVYHSVDKFWKQGKSASGYAASCAAYYSTKKRTDHGHSRERAAYHKRKQRRQNDKPVTLRKRYTTLLTSDTRMAQEFLMRGFK